MNIKDGACHLLRDKPLILLNAGFNKSKGVEV